MAKTQFTDQWVDDIYVAALQGVVIEIDDSSEIEAAQEFADKSMGRYDIVYLTEGSAVLGLFPYSDSADHVVVWIQERALQLEGRYRRFL